jgi:mannose-1-phosphate guanylyltransferase
MKAMILAAGYGKRLYPLTKDMPKCLIEVGGRPLIVHQIEWFKKNHITEIAVNLHYLPDNITSILGDGSKYKVKLTYSYEKELMGTAGGVKKIEQFFDNDFIVFYGDEYTNLDIDELKRYHKSKGAFLTICIREKPAGSKRSNIIQLDKENRIMKFVEKPTQDLPDLPNMANCGIYLCSKKVIEKIPDNYFFDFGFDVFPKLVNEEKVFGYVIPEKYYWCEVGSVEKYNLYKKEIEAVIKKNP